jgi:hypothetical protein
LDWTKQTVKLFNDPKNHNSGWIFWPWKRVPSNNVERYRHLYEIKMSPHWDKVRKYIGFLGKRPTKKEASKGLDELIEAMKIENCLMDKEIISILN